MAADSLPSQSSSPPPPQQQQQTDSPRAILIIEDDDTVASYYDAQDLMRHESNAATEKFVNCLVSRLFHPIKEGINTSKREWRILLVGQVLSVLIAAQGAAQSTLYLDCHLSAPTFATGLVYVALTVHLLPVLWRNRHFILQRDKKQQASGDALMRHDPSRDDSTNKTTQHPYFLFGIIPLQASPWTYLGIALLDVESNYVTVLAFRFTSLTSASVLDAMAIPSAMLFSKLCLRRRYLKVHLLGVTACLCGMVANVYCDLEQAEDDSDKEAKEYPHLVLGDCLAILGGLGFGARDVLTERNVREFGGTCEYLGMIGLWGTVISAIQVLLLERQDVYDFFHAADETCPKHTGLALLVTYVVTTATRYVGQAHFLQVSEAALLNLSLLTGDLWSAIYEIVAERIVPPSLFWVSLILVVGGVFVYEIGGSPIVVKAPVDLYLTDESEDVEVIVFARSGDTEEQEFPAKGWRRHES
jgi:solute carrier family 35 protein F1/2